ncbi:MAG: hypothetical protein ACE5GO_02900 [Anaerolineales bacterium]
MYHLVVRQQVHAAVQVVDGSAQEAVSVPAEGEPAKQAGTNRVAVLTKSFVRTLLRLVVVY